MKTTVHELLPDPNKHTPRGQQDSVPHSELNAKCLFLPTKQTNLSHYHRETKGRSISRRGTEWSHYVY